MKQCRQILAVMLALVLCIGAIPALADTMYVQTDDGADLTLRDEVTNAAIGQIPCGTAVTPDIEKSTDQWAYVTYEGTSGFVLWRYLSRKAPDAAPQPAPEPQPEPAPADPVTPPEQPAEEGGFRISVIGAAVSLTGDGASEAAVTVGSADAAYITAQAPEVDYWVINGVRYNFGESVTELRVEKADRDWTIEAVAAGAQPQTLLSAEAIQAARTGETLTVKGVRAELSHVDANDNPSGSWYPSFNFHKDYQNHATRYRENGGQISVRVRAVVPWGSYVEGWKFDETEFYPNAIIRQFTVRSLNTSMTYEPIFGTDPNPELPKVHVTCYNCAFNGGGYSGSVDAWVEVGTNIYAAGTLSDKYGNWYVNGVPVSEGTSLERTITTNTHIEFYPIIN